MNVIEKYKETIRAMSDVFDEIALALGVPPELYGDPDAILDAIDELKERAVK